MPASPRRRRTCPCLPSSTGTARQDTVVRSTRTTDTSGARAGNLTPTGSTTMAGAAGRATRSRAGRRARQADTLGGRWGRAPVAPPVRQRFPSLVKQASKQICIPTRRSQVEHGGCCPGGNSSEPSGGTTGNR
jgi:hypothetical protein